MPPRTFTRVNLHHRRRFNLSTSLYKSTSLRIKARLFELKGGAGSGNFHHEGRKGKVGGSSDVISSENEHFEFIKDWGEGEVYTTKQIASRHGTSTPAAYKILSKLEQQGKISKYGYKTKDGWEDPEYSGLSTNSLGWQRDPEN